MKRIYNIIMCVFALLFSAKTTAQQLQFDSNAEVQQGQTATLNIVLNNSEAVRGFQFDLSLPEGLSPVVTKVGETDHDLSVSKVGDSKWRVLSYSMDNAEYSADFGAVASVSISIPEDFAVGSYSISVSDAYLSDHDNSKVAVENFSASLNVLPMYIPVESVTLNSTALSLLLGQSANLSATISPEEATEKAITWSTSDSSVATISADGKVSAVGLGTATITATAADGSGVSASCVVTVNPVLNLDIVQGWNWISTFLDEPQAVDGLFANGVNRVLSQTQEAVDDPVYGVVGNVTSIEPGAGYKVSSAKDFALTWSGLLVDTDERPIVLRKGWNWIGYPYYESRAIETAVANAEEGDFVVAQGGFTEFADGAWGGSIERFDAGQGYLYKSVSDKTLQFDFAEQAARVKAAEGDEPTPNTNDLGSNADGSAYSVHGSKSKTKNTGLDIHKYPNTMNVTARLWREGAEVTDSRYVVKAFSDSELRGEGVCVNGTHYVTVYGDKAVEIAFVVEDTETGEQFSVAETLAFTSDVVGSRKSPFALTMDKATGIAGAKTDGNAADIYTVSGVKVQRASRPGVYVVNGRKVVVR